MFALNSKHSFGIIAVLTAQICLSMTAECPSFREFFSPCKRGSLKFDDCLLHALNKMRPCLQYGDPGLSIPVLEPIKYAEHGAPIAADVKYMNLFALSVTLPNITEWGWANSTYTKVKTDLDRGIVKIYQEVPFKHVISGVSAHGHIIGVPLEERHGHMTLDMYGVKQRYTIQLVPGTDRVKVSLVVLSVNDVQLQLRGFTNDTFADNLLNTALTRFWRLGYDTVKMFAYVLSDRAKTVLANKLFNTVDLQNLFTPYLKIKRDQKPSGNVRIATILPKGF